MLPHKRHVPSLVHLNSQEKVSFAQILSDITKRYDNLFSCSFAYSMGIHQRPLPPQGVFSAEGPVAVIDEDDEEVAHLHLHFTPPLLRNATVKKFLVGCVPSLFHARVMSSMADVADTYLMRACSFELMAEPQRDLTPEQAAARLRACPQTHYLDADALEKRADV